MATDHERDFAFTLTRSADEAENDGLTFEGYAAVFNQPAHIRDADGEYDEVFLPGAFKRTISRGKPYFMFCHGKHPLLGSMPLGTITELREDARGLFVKARLTDNWLISPVRDAIRDGAVTGMSIRFGPVQEKWTGRPSLACRHGELRSVHEARVVELGPVVVPSYADTTASVRSAFHNLEDVVDGLTINVGLRDATTTVSTHDQTVLDLVKSAVKDRLGLDDSDDVSPTDFYESDNRLIFTVFGKKASDYSGSYQADYTYADGIVTLSGDPFAVQATSYEPRSKDDTVNTHTRSDATFSDITGAVEDAIEEALGVDDVSSDIWICDITDTWAVFQMWGTLEDKYPGFWKVNYTVDADMKATIDTPVAVEEVYVPKTAPPARFAELTGATRNAGITNGPSDEPAAPGPSDEPAAQAPVRESRAPMTSPAEREAFLREVELNRRGIKVGAT